MDKLGWIFIVFGVILLLATSFGSGNLSLSPGNQIEPTDFQLLMAICGLAAVVAGIIKS